MPELQRLRADHAAAVLAFELANRGYFAASISDRGDEFFDQFAERHSALLAEQEAGIGAQDVAGRGVATATVRDLCELAAARYGLRTLRAAVSRTNAASQKVLTKAGFVPAGPADPADLGGKPGTWYQRHLAAG